MNTLERRVRAHVMQTLRDTSHPPSPGATAAALGLGVDDVRSALRALADEHLIVLRPGSDEVWMAAPFSAIATDFVVRVADKHWYTNCVWDGFSAIALLGGSGTLLTHAPATGELIEFAVRGGIASGDGIVHFLVPAKCFWDDIGFT